MAALTPREQGIEGGWTRAAKTKSGEHNPCPEAIEKHSKEHARSLGSYEWMCAEGCCGCAKDCGRWECPTCPSEAGPA